MDKSTQGAWLLAQSKGLDAVTGISAARLENISYAGRIGRLYNLFRRNVADTPNPTINAATVKDICHLNNIDRTSREAGLTVLAAAGRIDVAKNGAVIVLGATSRAILETTADIFRDAQPTAEEEAVLDLSEEVAKKPIARTTAAEFVGDTYKLPNAQTLSLIDLCKSTAIIDEEIDGDRAVLFNSNTFRDGQYASKAYLILDGLRPDEQRRLSDIQARLRLHGALLDADARLRLGRDLYRRLISVSQKTPVSGGDRRQFVAFWA